MHRTPNLDSKSAVSWRLVPSLLLVVRDPTTWRENEARVTCTTETNLCSTVLYLTGRGVDVSMWLRQPRRSGSAAERLRSGTFGKRGFGRPRTASELALGCPEHRKSLANSPCDTQSAVNSERIRPGMPRVPQIAVKFAPGCPKHTKTRGVGGSGAENAAMYGISGPPGWLRLAPFGAVLWGHRLFAFSAPSAAHGGVFGEAVADPPGDGHTEQQVIPRTPSQQLRVSFSGDLESAFPVTSKSFDSCGSDTASRVPSALRRD